MKYIYCTLFDSNYLDKGIAMAQSLISNSSDCMLYIYAFDKRSYEILRDWDLKNTEIILFEDIITDELNQIRKQRSRAEFCWTCTPFIIEYTLQNFRVDNCTYVDADLYFFSNPEVLIQEMFEAKCSIQIVEHRFPAYRVYKRTEKKSGKYCVEFNTFLNNEEGRNVLSWWREQCFLCCTSDWRTGKFGDQKYLDVWQEKFSGVHTLQNHGGGVAPWNICRYIRKTERDGEIIFQDKTSKKEYDLVFYHFHDMSFLNEEVIDINLFIRPGKPDEKFVKLIYAPYIEAMVRIRKNLFEKYDWEKTYKKKNNKKSLYEKIAYFIYFPLRVYQNIWLKPKDIMKNSKG